ncbi:MAG: hypothetical protein IJT01_07745 [Selenomonadaceae bacterium]|nr:hypothetical protein [Selenomonadaceae bacterium]
MKKMAAALLMSLMLMMSSVCMAEDTMHFVDANGSTGYYVDVASLGFEGNSVANARIAVKKAAMNRMFLYTMQFDTEKKTYRILESQVLEYDTKKVLESTSGAEKPRAYGDRSPMNSIVQYIYDWKNGKIKRMD